ncbi:unknown [Prevotella sp. CAG:873]|nr:unknown [Prevotella sp. CAG:873]
MRGIDFEQHLQYRDNQRKREQRQQRRQHIEQNVQSQILLIRRNKAAQQRKKIFHINIVVSHSRASLGFETSSCVSIRPQSYALFATYRPSPSASIRPDPAQ